MKNTLLVLFLFGILLIAGCAAPGGKTQTKDSGKVTGTGEKPAGVEEGRIVFAITDAAADMGAVSSVKVTVDSVRVHSTTEDWVTVSSTPKTYDLLELKAEGKQALLADIQLKEGTYQQIRLDISNVLVTDANGTHEAKLPSGELKIVGDLVVNANATSTVTFDFVADESLHVTGNGKYIMAPVIQVETKENAEVEVKSDNEVIVRGGKVKTNVKVGMDLDGNVGVNVRVPANIDVEVDAGGIIKIGKGRSERSREETEYNESSNTSAEANASIGVEVNVS